MSVQDEIERYLRTGHTEPMPFAWPGQNVMEKGRSAHIGFGNAVVAEVRRRAANRSHRSDISNIDTVALTRSRVEPMVRGLFASAEQDQVLAVLERSVIFLTDANIEHILRGHHYSSSAWDLANLYLYSIGAEPLGSDRHLLGISEHTTCYVTARYLEDSKPFDDFVVHEAAHFFHNCERETIGLPLKRRQEWLLPIDFGRRETFAYSCEVYSRIVAQTNDLKQRQGLAAEYAERVNPDDTRFDAEEHADIVTEAAGTRNGWKVILRRCVRSG